MFLPTQPFCARRSREKEIETAVIVDEGEASLSL